MSPALASRFLITGQLGKSYVCVFKIPLQLCGEWITGEKSSAWRREELGEGGQGRDDLG